MDKARLVDRIWEVADFKRSEQHKLLCEMLLAQGHALPPSPLKVFPQATGLCVLRGDCYHRHYKTHDTSASKLVLSI
jgi:hypothetical protein